MGEAAAGIALVAQVKDCLVFGLMGRVAMDWPLIPSCFSALRPMPSGIPPDGSVCDQPPRAVALVIL